MRQKSKHSWYETNEDLGKSDRDLKIEVAD